MNTSLITDREDPIKSRPSLLVVDDEAGPRESLHIIFKDDYEVLTAGNGVEALEVLGQRQVNVAVLDICMGGMSGIELLNRIKEQDEDIAVIMLTAYETVETACQALRLGACNYLSKPFDVSTIRAAVAEAVQANRCARQIRLGRGTLRELQARLHDLQVQEEVARKRGEIYALVLHDINNPLTVISSLAILANKQLSEVSSGAGPDVEGVKDQLFQIEEQVNRCLDISKRYLAFGRKQADEMSGVSVNQVLADVGMLLKHHPVLARNEFRVELLASDAFVQINGTDLIQILLNLSINGLQCTTEPHQVTLSAEPLQGPLNLAEFSDSANTHFLNRAGFANKTSLVRISVHDNGPGISTVPLEKIFEAFFTTKPPGLGTGLGLTIVVHLTEHAHGGLYVENSPGQGVTFDLFLPAVTGGAA